MGKRVIALRQIGSRLEASLNNGQSLVLGTRLRFVAESGPHEGGLVLDRFFYDLARDSLQRVGGPVLLRGPFNASVLAPGQLNMAEMHFLRTLCGVIVEERDGQVDVWYYKQPDVLEQDWRGCLG